MSIQKIIGNLVGCLSLCRCKSSCCGNKIVLEYEGHGVDPHTENHSSHAIKTVDIVKPTIPTSTLGASTPHPAGCGHTPSPILKHHFLPTATLGASTPPLTRVGREPVGTLV
jgi:hypothetical protein